MRHIAIIGASGFVGEALYREMVKDKKLCVEAVTRQNYSYWEKKSFDVVVNAAMPSARFWANNNPHEDFIETVVKTADIVYKWRYKKLIQISTLSARTEHTTIYGKHKRIAEELCVGGNNLIIRLTAMYGETLKKGVLIDILKHKQVYVDKKSAYSFASLGFISQWIAHNLNRKGLQELGAKNSLSLAAIVDTLNISIKFTGRVDIQEVQHPLVEFPDAKNVILFLKDKLNKRSQHE